MTSDDRIPYYLEPGAWIDPLGRCDECGRSWRHRLNGGRETSCLVHVRDAGYVAFRCPWCDHVYEPPAAAE